MEIFLFIRGVLETPALLIGFVTLLGLLLQKKKMEYVIKGTAIAIVGFVLLSAGSDLLQTGALKDFGVLFNYDFHIQGVIPNMEAVASLGIARYAMEVSMVMFFGMVANLVMARFGPFPYIFLTGHHTLYMACLLTVAMHGSRMAGWQIVVGGSLMLGLLMASMPALAQGEMRKATGGDKLALGHFSVVGYIIAAKTAGLAAKRERRRIPSVQVTKKLRSAEDIRFSPRLSFMRDSTVGIFVVTTGMFLIVSGIAAARTDLGALDISYKTVGFQSWITYSLLQGAGFSASIYIILAGVRLVVAEIVPAFKGIAKRIAPDAKPAVDCPVIFSYAPNAVMIGFLASFLGGVAFMLVLMGVNAQYGMPVFPVIVPGVAAHFFCGGSAGVFANAEGGVKGCVAGSFVHGIVISVLALAVMPVLGTLNLSGTSFSDADFCVVGVVLGNLAQMIPEYGMLALCVVCFLAPIVWKQARKHSV